VVEFLALAEGEAHLIVGALKVRWWTECDLWREMQATAGFLKTLFVDTELRVARLAEQTPDGFDLLGPWAL
jgi:hypothetical protein